LIRALADGRRRALLRHLADEDHLGLDELTRRVAGGTAAGADLETVAVESSHKDLPALFAVGLVDFDQDGEVAALTGRGVAVASSFDDFEAVVD
jgi:DNA-binding transcriptional ArsR family regulator